MTLTAETHWPRVFTDALRGDACTVHGMTRSPFKLPVRDWRAIADESDRVVLSHCSGPALDIGCGPGRMTEELAALGHHAAGLDVVPEAVSQTRGRGVAALHRDVFDPVPGEGRWACALLADGNIGIGGNPVKLLRRLHALLGPEGRVVVDLSPPGIGLRTTTISLECSGRRSEPFAWSIVGPESVSEVAIAAGFAVTGIHEHAGRWFAVLEKAT